MIPWARSFFGATVVGLASLATACGGDGGSKGTTDRAHSRLISVLYVVDHKGAKPKGNALAAYITPYEQVQARCGMSDDTLTNRILEVATEASNGSGSRVTNLEALRLLADRIGPNESNCPSVFAETSALLGGAVAKN